MARGRKRPRVVWLPADRLNRLGIAPAAVGTSTQQSVGIISTVVTSPAGQTTTEVVPLVLDKVPELALTTGTQSLADVTQSGYRLRRVVGKIWGSIRQDPTNGPDAIVPKSCILTVGLIVLRINEEDSQPLQNAAQYDAVAYGNLSDPWIWRRSWLLINQPAIDNSPAGAPVRNFDGLTSTSKGGSALDGPHIDAKTARVIGPEERLFMVVTTSALPDTDVQEPPASETVTVLWDLRVLGSMRSNLGNRRNASR